MVGSLRCLLSTAAIGLLGQLTLGAHVGDRSDQPGGVPPTTRTPTYDLEEPEDNGTATDINCRMLEVDVQPTLEAPTLAADVARALRQRGHYELMAKDGTEYRDGTAITDIQLDELTFGSLKGEVSDEDGPVDSTDATERQSDTGKHVFEAKTGDLKSFEPVDMFRRIKAEGEKKGSDSLLSADGERTSAPTHAVHQPVERSRDARKQSETRGVGDEESKLMSLSEEMVPEKKNGERLGALHPASRASGLPGGSDADDLSTVDINDVGDEPEEPMGVPSTSNAPNLVDTLKSAIATLGSA